MFSTDRTPPALRRALEARGYTAPTPVQALVSEAPDDADLLVSARTGSGKTVAFGLAMSKSLLGEAETIPTPQRPRALVIAPTRELALQVARELQWLYAHAVTRQADAVATCVGGTDVRREARALEHGALIVVGTPGRLCDHLSRGRLDLSDLRAVVLDEADEMLDMGFKDELETLLDAAPKERRTLMFSATLPRGIEALAATYQKRALRIAANATEERHADIDYQALIVAPREVERAVVNVLRHLDPPGALVFCATREGTNRLWASLSERGFTAVALSGDLTQTERTRALQSLRDGRARVLVATDVAARGLDLPDLALVIHADLPRDHETLLHRSGRTGRAGRKGTAVLIVPTSRRRMAERLVHDAKVHISLMTLPTAESIAVRDLLRVVSDMRTMADDVSDDDLAAAATALGLPADESSWGGGSTPATPPVVPSEAASEGDDAVAAETAAAGDAPLAPIRLVAALAKLLRDRLPTPEDLPETAWLHRRETEAAARTKARDFRTGAPERPTAPQASAPQASAPRAASAPAEPMRITAPAPVEGGQRPARRPLPSAPASPAWTPDDRDDGDFAPPPAHSRDRRNNGEAPWYRVNVGRRQNADPRWLIPIICRRGRVEKADIGNIRIVDNETFFQIGTWAAGQFEAFAWRPDRKDPHIRFATGE